MSPSMQLPRNSPVEATHSSWANYGLESHHLGIFSSDYGQSRTWVWLSQLRCGRAQRFCDCRNTSMYVLQLPQWHPTPFVMGNSIQGDFFCLKQKTQSLSYSLAASIKGENECCHQSSSWKNSLWTRLYTSLLDTWQKVVNVHSLNQNCFLMRNRDNGLTLYTKRFGIIEKFPI